MNWTNILGSLKAIHVSQDQSTSVFLYSSPSPYGAKVIVKQIACPSESIAQRAESEAQIARAHPHLHIAECLGYKREPNPAGGFFLYIFSPAYPKSLHDDVTEKARTLQFYSEQELWAFYEQLLDAFVYLQSLGVAHRDIKPHNVLLTDQRQLKICDFGFAKQIGTQGPAVSSLLGTMAYFSPALRIAYLRGGVTQVQHNPFKSDVYSLGMVLLHITLLNLPQKLRELPELQQNVDIELNKLTKYSQKWVELLRCMLRTEEDSRPDFLGLQARGQVTALIADDDYLEPLQEGVDLQDELHLSLKSGLSQVRVSAQEADEVPVLVSLQGRNSTVESLEQGTDLVCVVDKNGSMSGRTLQLVYSAMAGVVERLGPRDRMAFVCFCNNAEQRHPLTRGNEAGKAKLRIIVQQFAVYCDTSLVKGFLGALEVLKQRRYPNFATCILLFSDVRGNPEENIAPCIAAFRQSGLSQVKVSGIYYSLNIDCSSFQALVKETQGEFLALTSPEQTDQIYAFARRQNSSLVASDLQLTLTVQAGKVPCEITRVYTEDGSPDIRVDELHVGQERTFVFLLKPRLRDLAGSVRCKAVEAVLSYKDRGDAETFKSESLDVKFVKGGAIGAQDSNVYLHWRRANREFSSARCLIQADELLRDCMERLRDRQFRGLETVVEELGKARALIQSHSSWQDGMSTEDSSASSSFRQ